MGNSFRKGFMALVVGAALCSGVQAEEKTVVSFARFFGSCEADFGNVTDISTSTDEPDERGLHK